MTVATIEPSKTAQTVRVCERATLLVFADDWGRHPSSCQHLVKRLLDKHDVIWVNTISMRPPRLDWQTATRAAGKLRQWLTPHGPRRQELAVPSPKVLNPRMWPWMRSPRQQRLNHQMLLRQLRPVLNSVRSPVCGVTTLPLAEGLIGSLPVKRWVYYCVDDFTTWPGLDGEATRQMESRLFERCDEVVAASTVLEQRAAERGCRTSLLTHGVDLEHWRSAASPDKLGTLQVSEPQVLFFGLIDERLDAEWVRQLDRDLERGSIELLGPCQAAPDIRGSSRIRLAPAVSYQTLPTVAARADVLVMPYIDAPVTRAMQPLKLLEYLATDKPVVVRNLPANREWADALDLASSAEEFSRLVRLRLETGLPESQRLARARLTHESWDAKARIFERSVLGATIHD